MLDFQNFHVERFCCNLIPAKLEGKKIWYNETEYQSVDPEVYGAVTAMVRKALMVNEKNSFFHITNDVTLNPMFAEIANFFDTKNIIELSNNTTQLYYDYAQTTTYKKGELFICEISGLEYDGVETDAIAILKTENKKQLFLPEKSGTTIKFTFPEGIEFGHYDKACIIINTDGDSGFRILSADRNGPFWNEEFLGIKPCADEYHFTKDYLSVTKDFLTQYNKNTEDEELPVIDKTMQGEMLTKSIDYFKNNEVFNEEEFVANIFEEAEIIEQFNDYKNTRSQEKEYQLNNGFSISEEAVKKQSKVFKSVIKLDKNFHIYVHGNRNLIEKGFDEEKGKNYYIVYFDTEE